jgi:CarboxypepD_reg-like domain
MKLTSNFFPPLICVATLRHAISIFLLQIVFVGLVAAATVADARLIKGRVTDENNQPLGYVTVKVKGTERGAITDFSGNFQVEAENNDVLVFTYLGYAMQEVTVGASNELFQT